MLGFNLQAVVIAIGPVLVYNNQLLNLFLLIKLEGYTLFTRKGDTTESA